MRISPPPLPLPPNLLPSAVPPEARAALQIAAIAAATPWTALDALIGDRETAETAESAPGRLERLLLPRPSDGSAAAARGADPGPGRVRIGGEWVRAVAAAVAPVLPATARGQPLPVAPDRLSLSAEVAGLRAISVAPQTRPAAELLQRLLVALSGESASRLLLTACEEPSASHRPPTVAAGLQPGPAELLHLLIRGTVTTADARVVALTLGLRVQRQAAAVVLDATLLDSIRSAVEALASTGIDAEHAGTASALAGQSLRFQAVLDPLGLWPMQSFLLSGLLLFGSARDREATDEVDEADTADDHADARDARDDDDTDAPRDGQTPAARKPGRRKTRPAALQQTAAMSMPADGGPPIISGQHWLELELAHWRLQLRRWMALPTG